MFVDTGLVEYIPAPKGCRMLSDGLDFEVACLAEPQGVAVDVVYTAEIGLGDGVLGLAPIRRMAIPLARMQDASRICAANRSGGRSCSKSPGASVP